MDRGGLLYFFWGVVGGWILVESFAELGLGLL